jgi:translation initiation factor IF-1
VAKEEAMKMHGKVTEVLGNAMFRVKLDNSEHLVTAYVGGKMRKFDIKIIAGDSVQLEMSPYDLTKGRIIYRGKS